MLFTLLQTEMSYSLFEMAAKGGPLMWVLLLLSIVAIYIFGKKWWAIRQAGKIDKDFMMDIRDYIHMGKINKKWTSYREKYLNNLEIRIGATSFAQQTRDSIECRP